VFLSRPTAVRTTTAPLSLEDYRQRINVRLEQLYASRQADAERIDAVYGELWAELRVLVLRGGKRLRPYLTYLAYHGLGGTRPEALTDLAASQEILHNFMLIHDDVFDNDTMRYGGLNISGVYRQKLPRRLAADVRNHLADAMAIMGGDALMGLGFSAIIEADFPAEQRLMALRRMERMIFEIDGGEVLDVLIPTFKLTDLSEDRLLKVCYFKTATYSFEAPLQLGAIMAQTKGDPGGATAQAISRFALPLGVAYQLADDLLGTYGDEAQLGKSVLSDVQEGKRTLLMLKGMQLSTGPAKRTLQSILGNPAASYKDLARVRDILDTCGARAYVENLAEQHIARSLVALPMTGFTPEVRGTLEQLAQFSIHRNV
jgi:geranylgeranyl pyrophosphate synthase